jgi:tripartite-type tricarboxylate transporter receptor subunit TctC
MMRRIHVLVRSVSAILAISVVCPALSQNYPTKPVRVLVGFAAGSGTDTVMRIIGPKLADAWGSQVIVDNRPGAGGNIAAEIVAKAAADGYTILFANGGIAISPALYKTQPYNARTELAPIALVTLMPHMMCVNTSLPVKSVGDFVALARAKPGQVLFSSAGIGNSDHMAAELLAYMGNVKLTHVPNKGGPQALSDVISGQVAVTFSGLSTCLPHAKAGKVRALAVTSAKRSAVAPEVPTMQEGGLVGYEHTLWYGLFAPAGTPAAVISKISTDVAKVLAANDVRDRFTSMGIETVGNSPAEFNQFFQAELNKWAKVIKATGIQIE